jgi:DNA-binding MarR family transcriptional regulator
MTVDRGAQLSEPPPDSVAAIQRALTAIARRGRARARAHAPQLSLVDQSLLDYLHDHPDSRAADIAAHYLLDKSTVSRQLAGLVRDGLVQATDLVDARGKALRLTASGQLVIAESMAAQRQALQERLQGWTGEEVRAFARALERFNAE